MHLSRPFGETCEPPERVERARQLIDEVGHHAGVAVALWAKLKSQFWLMWRSRANKCEDDFFVLFEAHNLLMANSFAFGEKHCLSASLAICALDRTG